MENITFRNGLAVPGSAPMLAFEEQSRAVTSIALYGKDYLGTRWKPVVAEGDRIDCGTAILCDRHEPKLCIVSPSTGTIKAIELGARRRVERVVIDVDTEDENPYRCRTETAGSDSNRAGLVEFILKAGLWPALRTRPFGHVPPIGETPTAIFVNACQKTANNPDPVAMDASEGKWFAAGVVGLAALADKKVHICQSAAEPLHVGNNPKISCTRFSGAYSAHLAGTHIHALHDNSDTNAVWTIGWQDVLALGRALATGLVSWTRKVAIAGDAARIRVLTNAPVGASLRELAAGLSVSPADKSPMTVLSGDRIAGSPASHLHRFDDCVSLQPGRRDLTHGSSSSEAANPLTPKNALLNALPFGEPSLPLMRALMTHDLETAQMLGAERMVEEDVAQLTRLCASGTDYGQLLRAALDAYSEARG